MKYGIGLGSNLGDRLQNLQQALIALGKWHQGPSRPLYSAVYLTQAVGCQEGTPDFYNMAIELESELSPLNLLSQMRAIETQLGRPNQRQRNASRSIDLDILYADDLISQSQTLTLPHPRLQMRRFVLQPLADIRPDLILPNQQKNISTLLAELDSDEAALQTVVCDLFDPHPEPAC